MDTHTPEIPKPDWLKNLEREAALNIHRMTVDQAYRLADNELAKATWNVIKSWAGPQAKITPAMLESFNRLMKV